MAANPVELLEHILRIYGFMDDVNQFLRADEYTEEAPADTPADPLPRPPPDIWEAIPDLDPYALLGIRPSAPDEVVDAAFKALAKKFHPDRGGDTKMMAQLAAAYQNIKEMRRR